MFSSQGDFLRFLGPFSKQFGDGVNLGQEFWAAVSGPLQAQLPMVRLAMLASNYTAPQSKIANGLARLIVKADFDKLKSKLGRKWSACCLISQQQRLSGRCASDAHCICWARSTLYWLQKMSFNFEFLCCIGFSFSA